MAVQNKYDVIIAGCGVGGLYCALNIPSDKKVLLLCKDEMLLSNTALAQGGVAAVLDTVNDSYDLHFNDTLVAGRQENNPDSVRILVTEGPGDVRRIYEEMGVDFDKSPDGTLNSTLEGGHSRRRIVHHRDSTGFEIASRLCDEVKKRSNIEICQFSTLFNLERFDGGFFAYILKDEQAHIVATPYVVLATGGIGQVYRYTTNSAIATGDGIRLAYDLGCKIAHLDYVQFHPTSFAADKTSRQKFLISEAVRGEGAYLLNCNKERFMHLYDKRLELAPRDVVAKSIILESRRLANENFYLDIAYKGADFLKERFPMIYEKCLDRGVDITKEPIPIFPCQHYLMGGIDVNLNSKTDIDRLYAVGECSHTGVHGANRLASNSLLEALVFGRRSAQDITRKIQNEHFVPPKFPEIPDISGAPLPKGMDTAINDIMQCSTFVIPDIGACQEGLKQVDRYLSRLKNGKFAVTREYCEAISLATVAHIILKEMLKK